MSSDVEVIYSNRGRDYNRRFGLGNMFFDTAKYTLSIVVVGSLFSNPLNYAFVASGFVLAIVLAVFGYFITPVMEVNNGHA